MYRAVTRKIEVMVTPRFVSERSSPSNGYYFWAYTINITNLGPETVQLRTRHWRITDAIGLHGRKLWHGDDGGRAFRYRNSGVFARLLLRRTHHQLTASPAGNP